MSAYRTSYAVTLTCLLAAGCAAPEVPGVAPAYIGKITDPGHDAAVAVVSDGVQVTVYVCGGPTTYDKLTRWFQGDVGADGTFKLEKSGGFEVTGDLASGAGQVTTALGQTLSWSVRPTTNEEEGLYAAMDGSCRTGAVVGDLDGNGTMRLEGTWCDGLSRFAKVSPLTPAMTLTERGIGVSVLIEPVKTIFVERVRHP